MGSDGECHDCFCGWKQPYEPPYHLVQSQGDLEEALSIINELLSCYCYGEAVMSCQRLDEIEKFLEESLDVLEDLP